MKIAFLSPVGVIGGAERLLLDYVASLKQAEPDLELALFAGADGPLLRRAQEQGVHVILLPFPAALARAGDSALISVSLIPSARYSASTSLAPVTSGRIASE